MALTTTNRRSPRFFSLWLLLALWVLFSSCLVRDVSAQVAVNGQTYTDGLAIVNSPAMGSTITIGATMDVSIDVTGNGQIPSDSSDANSTAPTRISYLAAYLISQQQATNLTVVRGSDLLTGQPGSSVKQASFAVPACASPGSYALTIYEASVINGTAYFSITPIPVRITAARPGGAPCSTLFNDIEPGPQAASPPPFQPWGIDDRKSTSSSGGVASSTSSASNSGASTAGASTTTAGGAASASASGASTLSESASGSGTSNTATANASSSVTGITSTSGGSGAPVTVTKTVDSKTATVTVSATPSTFTTVFTSVRTQLTTLTASGTTDVLTTTVETVSTSTKVADSAPSNPPGFFPVVNAAAHSSSSRSITAIAGLSALMYLLVM